jgi:hypothetical protein
MNWALEQKLASYKSRTTFNQLCLHCIYPARGEKPIEIVIELAHVFFVHYSHISTKRQISSCCIYSKYFSGLVGFGNFAVRCNTSPITQDGMPYRDVLNARLLLPNFRDHVLEAVRECLPLGLEFNPTILKLTVTLVIDCLPIIVDDEVSDIDFILR